MDFSIAWSIQKGVDASTRKDSIWRIVAGLLENPENIPAIQQIISVVSTIEHLFLPFDKNLAVVGKQSSLLRVNSTKCGNIFYERMLQEFSNWSVHYKTSIQNTCKIIRKYYTKPFEKFMDSLTAKPLSLAHFPNLSVVREILESIEVCRV
jgi:hypothetical protein